MEYSISQLTDLQNQITQLEQEKSDLEQIICTLTEHSDFIEAELSKSNHQLRQEIAERCQIETALRELLRALQQEKEDLELLLEMTNFHSDTVENDLYEKLIATVKVACTDALTQIANRRHFDDFCNHEWKRLTRSHRPLSLIICDVDYFKQYNDTYGHPAGDYCLQTIAQAMKKVVSRSTDLVARYGGEEFAILLPETEFQGALIVAKSIQQSIYQLEIPHIHSQVYPYVTLSMGIACQIPERDRSILGLIQSADKALYQAKSQGRNQIVLDE